MAADVLADDEQRAGRVEEPDRVEPARLVERALSGAERGGQHREHSLTREPSDDRIERATEPVDRGFSADAAGAGRVHGAVRRTCAQRRDPIREPRVDRVLADDRERTQVVGAVDHPLCEQKPCREVEIVARGAHRDRGGLALDAELERLLDTHVVFGGTGGVAVGRDAEGAHAPT